MLNINTSQFNCNSFNSKEIYYEIKKVLQNTWKLEKDRCDFSYFFPSAFCNWAVFAFAASSLSKDKQKIICT